MLSRVAAAQQRERDALRLTRRPVRTLYLFAYATTRWCVQRGAALLQRPLLRRVLLPLLLALLFVSRVVVASAPAHAFAMLDRDKDGLVRAHDVHAYYARMRGDASGATAADVLFPASVDALDRAQFVRWWRDSRRRLHVADVAWREAAFGHGWWREVEYGAVDALFWLTLGILSSAGLGSGMHSGVLFLFPHIFRVCAAYERCGSGDFYTYPRNPLYGPRARAFVCRTRHDASTSSSTATVAAVAAARSWSSLRERVVKVMPACMAWGAGTALGEIPPYALSYAAATQTRQRHAHDDDMLSHEQAAHVDEDDIARDTNDSSDDRSRCRKSSASASSRYDVMQRMTTWMRRTIERHGFWAVLLLSAWPNMAFDLCGMACGQFRMPFATFLSATLLGKAVVKVNLQALFFVALFSGDNVEQLLRRVARACALPRRHVDAAVAALARARASIAARALLPSDTRHRSSSAAMTTTTSSTFGADESEGGASWLVTALQSVAAVAVGSFAKSIVESFAVAEQARRDAHTLAQLSRACAASPRHAAATADDDHNNNDAALAQLMSALHVRDANVSSGGNTPHVVSLTLLSSWWRRVRGGSVCDVVVCSIALLCLVAGAWRGSAAALTLGASLLLHLYVCEYLCSNASLSRWRRYALRACLAAAVLYSLLLRDTAAASSSS